MLCTSQVAVLCLLLRVTLMPVANVNCDGSQELDPFDMENFDQTTMKMKKTTKAETESKTESTKLLSTKKEPGDRGNEADEAMSFPFEVMKMKDDTCPKVKQTSCPAQSLFQQFVSRFLLHVKDKVRQMDEHTATDLCLRFSLSPYNLAILESFRKGGTPDGVFSAHEILTQNMHGAHTIGEDDPSFHILWIEEKFGVSVEKAVKVMVLVVLCAVFLLVLSKLQLRFTLFLWLLFLAFTGSVMTTWYRLYQGEVAKQHEALMQDLPAGCARMTEGSSSWENAVNFFRYSFTFQKDKCVEYYEHMVVDPVFKVSIMEALAVTVVQTILKPMRTIGTEMSEFMRALVKDLPVQWQLYTVILFFTFTALAMFLCCGYRLRVPFLLAIEPSRHDQTQIRQLEQKVSSLQSQVESIGSTGSDPTQDSRQPQTMLTQSRNSARRPVSQESLPQVQSARCVQESLSIEDISVQSAREKRIQTTTSVDPLVHAAIGTGNSIEGCMHEEVHVSSTAEEVAAKRIGKSTNSGHTGAALNAHASNEGGLGRGECRC